MARLILLVFTLVPLIEIALFILIGQAIGLWPTLLGVLVTALIGAVVIRVQGLSLLAEIRATMGRGQLPARALADAMLVGIAGALLLTPGYFTDLMGILLLVPAVRSLIYAFLKRNMVVMSSGPGVRTRDQRVTPPGTIDLDDEDWRRR